MRASPRPACSPFEPLTLNIWAIHSSVSGVLFSAQTPTSFQTVKPEDSMTYILIWLMLFAQYPCNIPVGHSHTPIQVKGR